MACRECSNFRRYSQRHDCSARVFRGTGIAKGAACERNGTVFEDGRWWCKQHAPSAKAKRQDEALKRLDGKAAVRARLAKRDAAHRHIAQVAIDVTRQKATMDDLVAAVAAYEALS